MKFMLWKKLKPQLLEQTFVDLNQNHFYFGKIKQNDLISEKFVDFFSCWFSMITLVQKTTSSHFISKICLKLFAVNMNLSFKLAIFRYQNSNTSVSHQTKNSNDVAIEIRHTQNVPHYFKCVEWTFGRCLFLCKVFESQYRSANAVLSMCTTSYFEHFCLKSGANSFIFNASNDCVRLFSR